MIYLKILKKSKRSRARLGVLETPHGIVETPALVPVATQAVVKTLTSEEAREAKCQILIANTYHLHLKPGEKMVARAGGLHQFMNWRGALMTDSGGFQVFSLGFGHDLDVGKIFKYFPGKSDDTVVSAHSKPKHLRITDGGVHFRSPYDGKDVFLGPGESIAIQEKLGADIMFAFDECTPPLADRAYAKKALERTHRWAKICVKSKKSNQALFGIVQGSHFKELRKEAAIFTNALDFPGFGIGGDLGKSKTDMRRILDWVIPELEESKPRHLLGIGHLEDIEEIVKAGVDTFDCTMPTHYARRGIAFTRKGRLDMQKTVFLRDQNPLDKACGCAVCKTYTRSYIAHLFRAKEITALRLLTFHNLFYFNTFVEKVRERIKAGKL